MLKNKNFTNINITVTDSQEKVYNDIQNIDILFLDIGFENSDVDGIEFAEKLREKNRNFYLVFLTGHYRYMHVSFLHKTYDYLLKPITSSVLNEFTNRLVNEFSAEKSIFLRLNKSLMIKLDSIYYIEKVGNKCEINTDKGSFPITSTLQKLHDKLPLNFVKSHKSFIINVDKIDLINKRKNQVILSNNKTCPVNASFSLEEITS